MASLAKARMHTFLKETGYRSSDGAVLELKKQGEKILNAIGETAVKFVEHRKKRTIQKEDIILAVEFMIHPITVEKVEK